MLTFHPWSSWTQAAWFAWLQASWINSDSLHRVYVIVTSTLLASCGIGDSIIFKIFKILLHQHPLVYFTQFFCFIQRIYPTHLFPVAKVDFWGFNSFGNRMISDFVLASWAELSEKNHNGSGWRSIALAKAANLGDDVMEQTKKCWETTWNDVFITIFGNDEHFINPYYVTKLISCLFFFPEPFFLRFDYFAELNWCHLQLESLIFPSAFLAGGVPGQYGDSPASRERLSLSKNIWPLTRAGSLCPNALAMATRLLSKSIGLEGVLCGSLISSCGVTVAQVVHSFFLQVQTRVIVW